MKTDFEINGLFYENKNLLCRKYLDIRRNETITDKPDLMVVMMNPGSSRPEDGNEKNIIASRAVPDKTQDQIMKVMNNCKFNYARILNLSDLREAKSKVFYSKLEELKKIPHSIFDDDRINDFKTLFVREIPVIFAWGVDKKLEPLATKAIERINETKPFGLLKEGTKVSYYHPLPQNYHEQEKWCEEISKMLKT
ncbi:MAG: DUF1643 domain-containing protein [Sulfurovum sp.]|nr:DUF1643 domain-containing protein [Sulfurovum sp.]